MERPPAPGSDLATLRRLNTRSVLEHLTEQPDHGFTVTELAAATRLSRPTVTSTLAGLVEHGWVTAFVGDSGQGRAGRPARHFRLAKDAGVCVGVDAGPHSVAVLVVNLANRVVASSRQESEDLGSPEQAVDTIERSVQQALSTLPSRPPVLSVSVAVPGVVAPDGRLRESVVVPEWVEADFEGRIAERFPGALVSLGNDVKLATFAEVSARDPDTTSNLLYLSIGRRISAGIVMGGRVQLGATGAAGELGASPAVAWGSTINDAMKTQSRTLREVVYAAREGEHEAASLVRGIGSSIAAGIALLALAVDPEVVVLAGPTAPAGELLAAPVRAALADAMPRPPRLEYAVVETEPSARGAVEQAIADFRRTDPLAD